MSYMDGAIDAGRDDIAGEYLCIFATDDGVVSFVFPEIFVTSQKAAPAIAIATNAMWSICM